MSLCVLLVAPVLFNDYWVDVILTQMLIVGIAAASLIFLAAYGGMISLAQTALAGTAGFILGNLVTVGGEGGETKGLALGWDPTLSLVIAIVGTMLIGLFFGAIAARSTGIYFLMITLTFSVIGFYFVGQVTVISGFSGIGGINRYTPGFVGDMVNDRYRLYYIAFGVALVVYAMIRFVVRTPFGLSLQGVRDEPVRMSSLGYAVPLHRTLAFGLAAFFAALSGVLLVWWQGQIAPGDVGLPATIDLLDRGGDRRPRPDRGSVGRSARVHPDRELHPGQLAHAVARRRAHRRQFQHDHRPDLPADRDRLTRWAGRTVGSRLGTVPETGRRPRRSGGTRGNRRAPSRRRRESRGKEWSNLVIDRTSNERRSNSHQGGQQA